MSRAPDLRAASATMGAVLASLASGLVLRDVAHLSAQIPVLSVVLALSLSRVRHASARGAAVAAVEVGVIGVGAAWAGLQLHDDRWFGGPLLVLGLSIGILARRYPPPIRRAGRLVGLPFIALLVTPAAPDAAHTSVLWAAVVAVIAMFWTTLAQMFVLSPAPQEQAATPERRRLDAPTRMALQMATGLTLALVAGHLLLGDGWAWALLSAYLVASGNRGRGDVVHKAGLRVVGGLAGTAVATLVAGAVPAGHRSALVALFVVMFAGLVLRTRSYAWWAASVTAMVALLHAYYGQAGSAVLGERLVGVVLGSALGVAAAWFVTPIRTRDVVRRRLFDCLAALTDDLAPDADQDAPTLPGAVGRLDELAPTLRAHRGTLQRHAEVHACDAVDAVHALTPLPTDPDDRRALRRATVWVRRSAAGRDAGDRPPLPGELATVHRVLAT